MVNDLDDRVLLRKRYCVLRSIRLSAALTNEARGTPSQKRIPRNVENSKNHTTLSQHEKSPSNKKDTATMDSSNNSSSSSVASSNSVSFGTVTMREFEREIAPESDVNLEISRAYPDAGG